MKLFVSYSHKNDELRERIISRLTVLLPKTFTFWQDVKEIQWGSDFPKEIEHAILYDVDFFICIVSDESEKSEWVPKEVNFAKQRMKELNREFILPIVVEGTSHESLWEDLNLGSISFAEITSEPGEKFDKQMERIRDLLFQLICIDMEKFLRPSYDDRMKAIDEDNKWLSKMAAHTLRIVFPHREGNPLKYSELEEELKKTCPNEKEIRVRDLVSRMTANGLLYGVECFDDEIYLKEEHASWNDSLRAEEKAKIAAYAFTEFIRKGEQRKTIYIDSGSTALELVRKIGEYYQNRTNTLELTVITPSTKLLQELSDICLRNGYANDSSDSRKLQLIVPGGFIHAATQTILQWDDAHKHHISEICDICKLVPDVAFIGANGITADKGIYTYCNGEEDWKRDAMARAKKTVILCDSGKFGVRDESLSEKVAGWENDFILITNRDEKNTEQTEILERFKGTEKIKTV